MPFSFNPTVSNTPNQDQSSARTDTFATPQGGDDSSLLNDAPTVPDSPLLFISQRKNGTEMTLNAYAQILLILITILSIVSALVIFSYTLYLNSSIEGKKEKLAEAEGGFKEYPFEDMQKVSLRIATMSQLLREYVSIRSPLKLLEYSVEDTAYFDEFTISKEKKTGYIISFSVITNDYKSLIQQLEALQLTQYTKIAPQPKYDNLKESNEKSLTVKVTSPVIIQGVLPDQIVFLSSRNEQNQTNTQQETSQTATTSP